MMAFRHVLPQQGSSVYIIPLGITGIVRMCRRDENDVIIIDVIIGDHSVHHCREFEIVPDWSTIYESGECPDCGETIPKDTPEGRECANCGHVFWDRVVGATNTFDGNPSELFDFVRNLLKADPALAKMGQAPGLKLVDLQGHKGLAPALKKI